jgi:hypothetical protein
VFDRRGFKKRVKRASERLFRELLGAQTDWGAGRAAFSAETVVRDWPLNFFDGADFRQISDERADNAVRAVTWWLIAFVETYIDPDTDPREHIATADEAVALRDAVRPLLAESEAIVDEERILDVAALLLTGREPLASIEFAMLVPRARLASQMRALVEASPRGVARVGAGVPLTTVWEPPAIGPMIPQAWYYWPDEMDEAYQSERRAWHMNAARGGEGPAPERDMDRCVFLDENMPVELRHLSEAELDARGVRGVPGQQGAEYLIAMRQLEMATEFSPAGQVAFLRDHLDRIGRKPPS